MDLSLVLARFARGEISHKRAMELGLRPSDLYVSPKGRLHREPSPRPERAKKGSKRPVRVPAADTWQDVEDAFQNGRRNTIDPWDWFDLARSMFDSHGQPIQPMAEFQGEIICAAHARQICKMLQLGGASDGFPVPTAHLSKCKLCN